MLVARTWLKIGHKPFFWYNKEMADSAFFGSDPDTPDPAANGDREADIARAAELGRKRSEREKALKEKIKTDRENEEKKAHKAAAEAAQKSREATEQKKEYRSSMKTREQELQEDKKRRSKQAQLIADHQKIHDDRKKVQQGYMKELHETSLIKQAMEKRQVELLAEKERERKHAEYDHRSKMELAEHADVARKEALEHESLARKAMIDTDVRTCEYQLEGWRRSRHAQVENEAQRQLAFATSGRPPGQAQQIRGMIEAQFRVKRKKVEIEWSGKKEAIEQEATRRKNDIDNDFYGKKAQSESELRRMMRLHDAELARKNEDIEQKYKDLLYDNKAS